MVLFEETGCHTMNHEVNFGQPIPVGGELLRRDIKAYEVRLCLVFTTGSEDLCQVIEPDSRPCPHVRNSPDSMTGN